MTHPHSTISAVSSDSGASPVVVFAQIDALVGDIPGNAEKIIAAAREAEQQHNADLVIFSELCLSGYPPEDLLLRPSLQLRVQKALDKILRQTGSAALVFGLPWLEEGHLYNAAVFIAEGAIAGWYFKRCLPNYQVFDEKRYFVPGDRITIVEWRGYRIGMTICEDIWEEFPAAQTAAAGADILININASPFDFKKHGRRLETVQSRARHCQIPILYLNLIGAQDELVFDGGSFAVNSKGTVTFSTPQFQEGLFPVSLSVITGNKGVQPQELTPEAGIYKALVLGVRDYINKNGFKSVVIGLSGGIDSAITLAVAVDALGADRVRAVMMPFKYTSQMSLDDAEEEAVALGVEYNVVSIETIYESFMGALDPLFAGLARDTTEENIQARIRGVILMGLSNKTGALVLTTGNKSEMAVGYATL